MATTAEEHVVLVDEHNVPIGTVPKAQVHASHTPLHRGFSVFVFRENGDLLLQQRSHMKKTWPLVWSNSCCGHPALDETEIDAARRRLNAELGITVEDIVVMLPTYRYRAEKDGVVENEFCPVMVAFTEQIPRINPGEVEAIRWIPWRVFFREVETAPTSYSPWCTEETKLLRDSKLFSEWLLLHDIVA